MTTITNVFTSLGEKKYYAQADMTACSRLPPGCYKIEQDMRGWSYEQVDVDQTDIHADQAQREVLKKIQEFWLQAHHYKALGFAHKRGVLLYGPPGTGKTTVVRMLYRDVLSKNGICFRIENIHNLDDFFKGLATFRQIDKTTPVMVWLDEVDKFMEHNEEELMTLLDGGLSLSNILFVGTTNKLEKLSERVLRPSRFDMKIEIGFPDTDARREFVSSYLKDKKQVDSLVKLSKDKSIAEIKEMIIQTYCKTATKS